MNLLQQLQDTVQKVDDGMLSELDALIDLRELKTTADLILGAVKQFETENAEDIANQANEHPNGYRGFKVTLVSGRKTYDYSGVPEVMSAKDYVKDMETKYKRMHDSFISGNTNSNVTTDGEILPMPRIKYGSGYLKVTASKS